MDNSISTVEELETHYGEASPRAQVKQLDRLDKHCRHFISLSPLLMLASSAENGPADCSPRGDAPGFVQVIDETTIVIPDRPGNRRVDSFRNIMENPHVGLLFLVPGIRETLRVNGRATLTTDEATLAPMEERGKMPVAGLVVKVEEVYMHCAKALIRSDIWNPEKQVDRKEFPSLAEIFEDHIPGTVAAETEESLKKDYSERLY